MGCDSGDINKPIEDTAAEKPNIEHVEIVPNFLEVVQESQGVFPRKPMMAKTMMKWTKSPAAASSVRVTRPTRG